MFEEGKWSFEAHTDTLKEGEGKRSLRYSHTMFTTPWKVHILTLIPFQRWKARRKRRLQDETLFFITKPQKGLLYFALNEIPVLWLISHNKFFSLDFSSLHHLPLPTSFFGECLCVVWNPPPCFSWFPQWNTYYHYYLWALGRAEQRRWKNICHTFVTMVVVMIIIIMMEYVCMFLWSWWLVPVAPWMISAKPSLLSFSLERYPCPLSWRGESASSKGVGWQIIDVKCFVLLTENQHESISYSSSSFSLSHMIIF